MQLLVSIKQFDEPGSNSCETWLSWHVMLWKDAQDVLDNLSLRNSGDNGGIGTPTCVQ